MSGLTPALAKLIDALCCLPGIGPKSAQRMAFHLLQQGREQAPVLSNAIQHALDAIQHCEQCRNYSETPLCPICQSTKRQKQKLCIVETPADVLAIEQTHAYNGTYFVLMGHLSPLDGIGPQQLGLDKLKKQFADGTVEEVILATNPTVEGDATANFIADMAKQKNLRVSRIARGVPRGGELELIDLNTLMHAFSERVDV
ncbi:MAG: recombination protein RecR [marine bacterium B5-7]|nr:MAG: recombination protein RecR [marine bacterium B5-7]